MLSSDCVIYQSLLIQLCITVIRLISNIIRCLNVHFSVFQAINHINYMSLFISVIACLVESFAIFEYTIVYCRIIIKCDFLFLQNFLIIIESILGKIHIINEVKTSCEDNIWKCSLNCTFLIFSFFSATFLDGLFFASFNLCSFLIWSIYNKEDIYVKSVLEFICLIGELVV